MKKLKSCFSIAFLILVMMLFSKNNVYAQDRTDFNIQDGYLSKYAGSTPTVEIPDDVTTIGSGVFKKHTEITSVTIPSGVTVIESEAFSGCKNLQNVTLPNGLVSIEKEAFKSCSSFTNISIPGSVTNIGNRVFAYCEKVSSINIADGVQAIDSYAFYGNDYVTSVVIPDSVTSLGSYAFANCKNLQDITFSKSLTTIPSYVVGSCKKIKKLKIPDGVQILENNCFNSCSNLTYLAIPDSVTSITKFGMSNTQNLRIYCNTGTAAYDYAVLKNIFYVPLANYESESSGSITDTTGSNTGTNTGGNGNTSSGTNTGTTGSNTGTSTGGNGNISGGTNTGTTGNPNTGSTDNKKPDTSTSTPTKPEKSISAVECINRKCVRVSFSDGTNGIYDVPQMTPKVANMITIKEGGKQYQYSVICPAFELIIESVQAISANKVQIKYSGDFVWDRNGSQIDPDFVISGFTDAGGLETNYDQDNKIMVLTSSLTTKKDTLYTVQAINYDEGVVIFNQNSFYGYEPVVSEPVQTPVQVPSTKPDTSNQPTVVPPVENTNTSTDSSSTGNSSSSNNNSGNNTSSGTGWNNDYEEPEYEEPEYNPPKLSTKKKTLKRRKAFTLRVNNVQSTVKWKVGNKRIAKINKTGRYSIRVKGVRKGITYITARVDGKVLKCKIKVK